MQGYQFAHMEVWSNKGRTGAGGDDAMYRKNGQRAWTAQQIFDELERLPGASEHVINERPGPQILPGVAATFQEMRDQHEAASSIQEAYGKKGLRRKLRSDASSLYVSVFSLPVRTEDALADEAVKAECMDVLEQALQFETDRISEAGGRVLGGVLHLDEEHLHLHIVAVDPVRGRVDNLHPGRVAKKAVNDGPLPKGEVRTKLASRAYRDAMVKWQDDVHREVFGPAGLLRLGPGRSRYSRAEYQRVKTAQEELASYEAREGGYAAWDSAQEQRQEILDAREMELDRRVADTEAREAAARATVAAAEKSKAEADALCHAMHVGSNAIATRALDYRVPTAEHEEGLEFGPAAPKSKKERRTLMDIVRPAYGILTGLAKKVFNLRKRQHVVQRQAAENLQAAADIAKAYIEQDRKPPEAMNNIIDGEPLPLGREAFPDALFIQKGTDAEALQKQIDELPNLTLRKMWVATWQSQHLCDERPDLAAELGRGVDVLEFAATLRGFDLEVGKHEPKNAKDPHRARLHVDTEREPMRVFRIERQRVLVRA